MTPWQRIEHWLQAHAPEIAQDLNPGASPIQITKAEKALGVGFPHELRTAYNLHDGSRGGAGPLFAEWRWLSLKAIQREWKTLKDLLEDGTFEDNDAEPDPGIQADWWNPAWIPIASNGSGDFVCLDLAPSKTGTPGQIIVFWHTSPERRLLASSFTAWLEQYATALENKQYRVKDGWLHKVKN